MKQISSLNALIIFIKNPVAGKAKTRLAKDVGDEKALEIYKSLLAYTRTIALLINAKRYLYYGGEILDDDWDKTSFIKRLQSEGDLGERMSNAFTDVLAEHNKVLIIGSDCPQLDLMTISRAYEKLEDHDYVVGPSKDGGYYLLGMKELTANVFSNIEWSTDNVCSQTVERIKSANMTFDLLPELSDVDYKEDWDQYGWEL